MQARDVMTHEVVTVGPATSATDAAGVMAERGFAALPVVDADRRLVGIVAEADVLRDRLPQDPRLHLRHEQGTPRAAPGPLVRDVMTEVVRTVESTADLADIARLLVDERLRSVPVLDRDRLIGIVSRRDVLRVLARPDDELGSELRRLVEEYTGDTGCWDIAVSGGTATIRRTRGRPQVSAEVEEQALRTLALTVGGVLAVRVQGHIDDDAGGSPAAAAEPSDEAAPG